MNTTYVAGESTTDLLRAFGEIEMSEEHDGRVELEADLAPDVGAPFMRALLRVEAELLLADADGLLDDARPLRTPDQRRADAFVALTQRVVDAVRA